MWAREHTAQTVLPVQDARVRPRSSQGDLSSSSKSSSRSSSSRHGLGYVSTRSNLTPTPSVAGNPLMPLRKRLARVLRAGKRGSVEVQLLLELIDALEHYIRATEQLLVTPTRSSTPHSVSAPATPPTPPATFASETAPASQACIDLLSEVRSLVKELVEFVPDAQVCLTSGQYGPLAFPCASLHYQHPQQAVHHPQGANGKSAVAFSSALPSLPPSTTHAMVLHDMKGARGEDSSDVREARTQWWPRRLSRDCRALLEDVGFSVSVLTAAAAAAVGANASTPTLGSVGDSSARRRTHSTSSASNSSSSLALSSSSSLPAQGAAVSPTATAELGEALQALNTADGDTAVAAAVAAASVGLSEGQSREGGSGADAVDLTHHHQSQFDVDTNRFALPSSLAASGASGGGGGGATGGSSSISKARREQLLVEGQKRWEAYRRRQNMQQQQQQEDDGMSPILG